MATQKPENKLAKKLLTALRGRNAWAVKTAGGPFQRGLPDILGCYRSVLFGLEVKMPERKNKVTPLQQSVLDEIDTAGGYSGVVTSVPEALAVLDEIDDYLQSGRKGRGRARRRRRS